MQDALFPFLAFMFVGFTFLFINFAFDDVDCEDEEPEVLYRAPVNPRQRDVDRLMGREDD